MSGPRHSESGFETVIEAHVLQNGYMPVARDRAIALRQERRATLIAAAVTGQLDIADNHPHV